MGASEPEPDPEPEPVAKADGADDGALVGSLVVIEDGSVLETEVGS